MKILVVDDERIIVQGILTHLGRVFPTEIASQGAFGGQEALEAMAFFHPDLLITDIQMPGIDGLELIRLARLRSLCRHCVILTAHENFSYAKQAVSYQALSYLVKPVDFDELDGLIRQLLSERAAQENTREIVSQYQSLWPHIEREDLSYALGKLVRYVRSNFANDISLMQMAEHSGLSENYICTLFKKELDITFLDFVNELRLKRSVEALSESRQRTMHDIAAMVGYHSERQFFRMFKAKLGMTPQQFRERINK